MWSSNEIWAEFDTSYIHISHTSFIEFFPSAMFGDPTNDFISFLYSSGTLGFHKLINTYFFISKMSDKNSNKR